MQAVLIDHVLRILDHVPTRCMRADALHERAVRETAQEMPYARFVEALAARRERFTLLDCPIDIASHECWSEQERDAYVLALAQAGCTGAPMVALVGAPPCPATRPAGPVRSKRTRRRIVPAPAAPACPRAELLGAVHTAIADLLQDADPGLHETLAAAVAELESIRRTLDPAGPTRVAS